jgi:hypothetical protein
MLYPLSYVRALGLVYDTPAIAAANPRACYPH